MAATPYLVTRGVVLRETLTKEADKILTLLTDDRGKISVIARGVRRKGCKYAACAQPPTKAPHWSCLTVCAPIWMPLRWAAILPS